MTNETKTKTALTIGTWFKHNQMYFWTIISICGILFQCYRNWIVETKIENLQRQTQHNVEASFAIGIGGVEKSNQTLETEAIERRTQIQQIYVYLDGKKISLPPTLAVLPDMPKYESITETRRKIQDKMLETEKKED